MKRKDLGRKMGRQDVGTGRSERLEAMHPPKKTMAMAWANAIVVAMEGEGLRNLSKRRTHPISQQIIAEGREKARGTACISHFST